MSTLTLEPLSLDGALVGLAVARGMTPALWSGHAEGRLRAWAEGRCIRELAVGRAIDGFDVGHGMLATWRAAQVTSWDPSRGTAPLERGVWTVSGRCVRAVCSSADALELYVVDVDGHPYDRCGHRHRVEVGGHVGPVLATAWGEPPGYGLEGVQPQPPTDERVLFDGPTGRVVQRGGYGSPALVTASPRGHGDVILAIGGGSQRGATLSRRARGAPEVIVWDTGRIVWCDAHGAPLASIDAHDVDEIAAFEDAALVRSPRGLAWLALSRG